MRYKTLISVHFFYDFVHFGELRYNQHALVHLYGLCTRICYGTYVPLGTFIWVHVYSIISDLGYYKFCLKCDLHV